MIPGGGQSLPSGSADIAALLVLALPLSDVALLVTIVTTPRTSRQNNLFTSLPAVFFLVSQIDCSFGFSIACSRMFPQFTWINQTSTIIDEARFVA